MADGCPDLNAIIDEHLAAFDKPGVLSVRPGFKVTNDWLTDRRSIVVHDFTSAHVLTAIEEHLAGKRFELVLDNPPQNALADQTDADTVADLRTALGGAFDQAWALTRLDGQATAWIYPTAYHINVAVRDNSVFWLSSGNWNNSNQPDIDPLSNPADAPAARHCDRDWHVVVEQPQLARVFEAYLLNDLSIAAAHNTSPEPQGPWLRPARAGSAETPVFNQFFPAGTVSGRIKITPLLTPIRVSMRTPSRRCSAQLRRRFTCSFSTSNFRRRRTRRRRASST
jgi:hypothetical protein